MEKITIGAILGAVYFAYLLAAPGFLLQAYEPEIDCNQAISDVSRRMHDDKALRRAGLVCAASASRWAAIGNSVARTN